MRRAVFVAAIVGSALVLINHGDHLLAAGDGLGFWINVALSYAVPFTVSLVSANLTRRAIARASMSSVRPTDQANRLA